MTACFDPWLTAWRSMDVLAAQMMGAPQLAALQHRRWHALRQHAGERSPLYRDRLGHARNLADVPPATKGELMAAFDRWVTDPRLELASLRAFLREPGRIGAPYADAFAVWESSGSQGEPGIFVQDAAAMAVYDALEVVRRPWQGSRLWWPGRRMAFIGAIDGHFASAVTAQRLRRLSPALHADMSVLSFLQPIGALVQQLNELAPDLVATYPTMAVTLAEEQVAGRLRIRLSEVWTGGETLSAAMRRLIELGLGCPVFDSYGASEFLPLAAPCRCGALHLNSDWAILEPVDERGQAVPAGHVGHTTLLTNLANHVQPLIRYDLGDRVVVHVAPCACGSPLPVIDVEGRCDDPIVLHRPGDRPVRLLPLALVTVLEEDAGVFDFQLLQLGPSALRLSVGGTPEEARRAARALRAFLRSQDVTRVQLTTLAQGPRVRGRTGKLKRIIGLRRCATAGPHHAPSA